MNILTDEKLFRLNVENAGGDWIDFARAVESAVLEKLKQQEPVGVVRHENGRVFCCLNKTRYTDSGVLPDGTRVYAAPMPPDDSDAVKALEVELEEQCRLNGMGSEREAKLLGKVEQLERVLKEVYRWAEPMQDAPRGSVPNWFYKVRDLLFVKREFKIAAWFEEECP